MRKEIIQRAQSGEPMTYAEAVEVLETYKAQGKQASDTPRHDAMIEAVREGLREAEAFIENATIHDLPTLLRLATDHASQHLLMVIELPTECRARMSERPDPHTSETVTELGGNMAPRIENSRRFGTHRRPSKRPRSKEWANCSKRWAPKFACNRS